MRRGITLTEVLVALFIMAIGILAILTLFPAGLITMGQALKDDRATQCANQANAYMRWYWQENVLNKPTPTEDFFLAMNSPGGGLPAIPSADPNASYPVLVDPMGIVMRSSPGSDWVGDGGQGTGTNQTNVPRRTLALISSMPLGNQSTFALRTCSLLDTFGYKQNGEPLNNYEMRTLPYNWAWLLQRKDNREQFTAEMKILVYDKRVHIFAPSAMEKTFTPTSATVGQSNLAFAADAAPAVQKGGWLLDVSSTQTGGSAGVRNANFYRVVSATDGGNGIINVELQTPLVAHSGNPAGFNSSDWRFAVLDGLYEVFEVPQLRR